MCGGVIFMREHEKRSEMWWQTLAAKVFVGLVALLGGYLLFRYAVGILLPFLIACALGAAVHPLATRVSGRTRVPQGLCAAVLMILMLTLVTVLVIAVGNTFLEEVSRLLTRLEAEGWNPGERLAAWMTELEKVTQRIPLLRHLRKMENLSPMLAKLDEMAEELLRETMGTLSRRIPEWIGRLIRAIPAIVIFLVVTLVAGFYFSVDPEGVKEALRPLLPRWVSEHLPTVKKRLGRLIRQYARAYLLLLTITFLELYVALLVLGIDYAFLIAAAVALIDILPALGVGIVLVPWAIALLIGRQFYQGFGLLIAYAAISLVRQILEPRVVAGALGLHPVVTLFCMYGGYRLFGILGMMLAPALVIFLSGMMRKDQSSSRSGP